LPKTARIVQYDAVSNIADRKAVSVGGFDGIPPDGETIGRIQGRWGRKARFVASQNAHDVSVSGARLEPGESVNLGDLDTISSPQNGIDVTYRDSKPDGVADGGAGDGNDGNDGNAL
jgi:hypothetical protein